MSKISTLGIIAPAASLKEGEEDEFYTGIKYLESLGLKIIQAENLLERKELFEGAGTWLPGDANRRIEAMMQVWSDSSVDALMSMRGGYGCVHLLDKLDYAYIAKNPKPLFGYSDLTALFAALSSQAYKGKLQSFHSPMVSALGRHEDTSRQSFIKILEAIDIDLYKESKFRIPLEQVIVNNPLLEAELGAQGSVYKNFDSAVKLEGGNLTLVSSLLGTAYQNNYKGSVLFLEDLKEPAYKIDRMMQQLDLAGCFDEIVELWLGKAWDADYNYPALEQLSTQKGFKLIRDLPVGHDDINLSLAIG